MLDGDIEVSISAASDTILSNPQNNQVLAYNSGTAKWTNATPSSGGATTIAQVSGLQAALDAKATVVIDPSSTSGLANGTLIAYTN